MRVLEGPLTGFTLTASDDEVKTDLEVVCNACGDVVCDAEHGDTLALLADVAEGHLRTCRGTL